MKISNCTNINFKQKFAPNFTSNMRIVNDATGKLLYRNTSYFFRDELNWDRFVDILIDKYKDAEKVHIYNYACSEGAEPFSLAMLLIKKLGAEKAQKFFPIMASDIDEEILKNPMHGIIKPSAADVELIKRFLGDDYTKFVRVDNYFKWDKDSCYQVCTGRVEPVLRDAVTFDRKNIITDIKNVQSDDSVVMCRNFWSYLSDNDRETLLKSLSEKLGNNSMCIIGDVDDIGSDLLDTGFVHYAKPLSIDDNAGIRPFLFVKNQDASIPKTNNPLYFMNIFAGQKVKTEVY